jgi:hypothetical protein
MRISRRNGNGTRQEFLACNLVHKPIGHVGLTAKYLPLSGSRYPCRKEICLNGSQDMEPLCEIHVRYGRTRYAIRRDSSREL